MTARLSYANIIACDPQRLCRFYADLLGFEEIATHQSPIYACLDAHGMELGFNAEDAYRLLDIADRKGAVKPVPTRTFLTFELEFAHAVDALALRAVKLGGRLCKAPYDTYYNARQAVLCDPETNVFRLNHRNGPRKPADTLTSAPWITADGESP